MKERQVSKQTGYPVWLIRYYVERGMLAPLYRENVFGDEIYDYREDDIQSLKEIVILRKCGFTPAEITKMETSQSNRTMVLMDVKKRVRETGVNPEVCRIMELLPPSQITSVADLAGRLADVAEKLPLPAEPRGGLVRQQVLGALKKTLMLALMLLPLVVSGRMIGVSVAAYRFPRINPIAIAMTLLTLIPIAILLLLPKMKIQRKGRARIFLLILCVISTPISMLLASGVILQSGVTDIRYYRQFDDQCLAEESAVFQELFPEVVPESVLSGDRADAVIYNYQYFEGFEYTFDICAQWQLEETAFDEEVDRVKVLFENVAQNPELGTYQEVQQGTYTCLTLFEGKEPFREVDGNYSYLMFAFDETTYTVRYIYCRSLEGGVDQPAFLDMNWK